MLQKKGKPAEGARPGNPRPDLNSQVYPVYGTVTGQTSGETCYQAPKEQNRVTGESLRQKDRARDVFLTGVREAYYSVVFRGHREVDLFSVYYFILLFVVLAYMIICQA